MLLLVEEDVRRLHVPVHEAPPVGGVERTRHLGQDRQRPLGRERALALENALQVAPLHVAHREVELPVAVAGLVDRDHVRMVERRREARLAQEATPEVVVLGELGGDQLERHWPFE